MIAVFAVLIWRLMVISIHARDLGGALIAGGIMGHIALQVILNIAVVTNTIPNTGITLPFISYGGTSVLFLLGEMGACPVGLEGHRLKRRKSAAEREQNGSVMHTAKKEGRMGENRWGVYQILGGRRLCGTVTVQGSKNAVLPMIAAAVLTKEEVVLEGCPKISDVEDMAEIVRSLGGTVWWGNALPPEL